MHTVFQEQSQEGRILLRKHNWMFRFFFFGENSGYAVWGPLWQRAAILKWPHTAIPWAFYSSSRTSVSTANQEVPEQKVCVRRWLKCLRYPGMQLLIGGGWEAIANLGVSQLSRPQRMDFYIHISSYPFTVAGTTEIASGTQEVQDKRSQILFRYDPAQILHCPTPTHPELTLTQSLNQFRLSLHISNQD